MAKTLALARKLGHYEDRYFNPSQGNTAAGKLEEKRQTFSYIIVIDFESTCWDRGQMSHPNEIIEFPALLVELSTGEILSEFHYYVLPMEQPHLSNFCTKLTGISQEQVDCSSPLDIIMSKFRRWILNISNEYNFSYNSGEGQLCAFLTWTNWDLGVCLAGELKRKGMTLPDALKSWIDLKALYKKFYMRAPKGLKCSMNEVGLEFEGREHSGIIDSRNTARLLMKMVNDGCSVELTKSHVNTA